MSCDEERCADLVAECSAKFSVINAHLGEVDKHLTHTEAQASTAILPLRPRVPRERTDSHELLQMRVLNEKLRNLRLEDQLHRAAQTPVGSQRVRCCGLHIHSHTILCRYGWRKV